MIKLRRLNYKNLLNDINLEINKGEFISLVGENGSGKTTLALLMAGLLEDDVDGMEVLSKPAIVFENPDNQIIGTTVEEDIAFGLQNLQIPREEMNDIINKVLDELDILNLKNREIITLSGGQKQKVAFASLISLNYDFYILDEVTSMLDPESKKIVLDLIKKLNEEGKTIIQITHFIEELEMTERTILMKNSKIIYDGKTNDFLKNEKLLKENRLI